MSEARAEEWEQACEPLAGFRWMVLTTQTRILWETCSGGSWARTKPPWTLGTSWMPQRWLFWSPAYMCACLGTGSATRRWAFSTEGEIICTWWSDLRLKSFILCLWTVGCREGWMHMGKFKSVMVGKKRRGSRTRYWALCGKSLRLVIYWQILSIESPHMHTRVYTRAHKYIWWLKNSFSKFICWLMHTTLIAILVSG